MTEIDTRSHVTEIDALLEEHRSFPPPPEFAARAIVTSTDVYASAADPQAYWASEARRLDWMRPWHQVLEWNAPHVKWFLGGHLNVSANCVDRHANGLRRDKAAFIWEGEPGDTRTLTYAELHREVCKCANVLKSLGIGKGDRVAIYLPLIPEAAIAMLACTRIGAIHSVVFGGFSPDSLRDRINDATARLLITADGGYRRGNVVPLKTNADKAVEETPSIEHVLVVRRHGADGDSPITCDMRDGRDSWWHDRMATASAECAPEAMDAEDVLFIL